jgi:DNA polymerase elongation subunit (family B)
MRAFNISYETKILLSKVIEAGLRLDQIFVPPIKGVKFGFVKHEILKGMLGIMEEDLMNNRKVAKAEMNAETDKAKKNVLDARQNSLKIVCNSAYGFVKANMMCDKDLMEAVTAFGRRMLEIVQNNVVWYRRLRFLCYFASLTQKRYR